jgi:hypothetical protein
MAILSIGPIVMLHAEGTILSFAVTAIKVFAVLALNIVLVEFSRLYERSKDFQGRANADLQLPLTWIGRVDAKVRFWWHGTPRRLKNRLILGLQVAAVSIYEFSEFSSSVLTFGRHL